MSTGEDRATDIFGPYGIGPLSLKNRFVRSATAESSATPDGVFTEAVFPIHEALAQGGVGLIITGHMYADDDGKCSSRQTGIARRDHLPGLRRLAQVCRSDGTHGSVRMSLVRRVFPQAWSSLRPCARERKAALMVGIL
ncbi:MAG: hypothetical protein M1376_22865 [Planctomycetes bacterium]|nr:hypothetical protein [Planctomycetota bacterium]